MNVTTASLESHRTRAIHNALDYSVKFWFMAMVVGQVAFVYYIVAFYGGALAHGTPEAWNKVLPHGYVAGDVTGNLALGAHLLVAAIVTLSGLLQVVPKIRSAAPTFHRWNGRVYVSAAIIASLTGIVFGWSRGTAGGAGQGVGITINGLLILLCAVQAWRYARARDFACHRRWALRLFLVASGVWFFRVGLMMWLIVNHGQPVGFDAQTFTGPALIILGVADYLLPLALLEIYMRAKSGGNSWARLGTASLMFSATLLMCVGIFGAIMGLWLPRLASLVTEVGTYA